MQVETQTEIEKPPTPNSLFPEVEFYFRLLLNIFLIDRQQHKDAISVADSNVNRLQYFNRRTLNQISGKIFFYYSFSYELENRTEEIRG